MAQSSAFNPAQRSSLEPGHLLPTLTVPPCPHRRGMGRYKCGCGHPSVNRVVMLEDCRTCPLIGMPGTRNWDREDHNPGESSPNADLRKPTTERPPCRYLGDELRREPCSCPAYRDGIPVFACALHQECVLSRDERERVRSGAVPIRTCETCRDRQAPPPDLPSVAVVIPCHNYGRFLREAIDSARTQSHPPAEIIVVDDSSTDDTADVARAVGVRYLRIDAQDVWQARRAGYESTQSDLLCFLDADDKLSPDYLREAACMLSADWRLGIVYSDMRTFGDESSWRSYPETIHASELHRRNVIHAGSVVRRSALRITQAFEQHPPQGNVTHGDYHLWKVLLRHGWHARKQAQVYHYRKHGQSMMDRHRGAGLYDRHGMCEDRVTILIPLAGRLHWWPILRDWLDRQTWPREQVSLVLADTSQSEEFATIVRDWIARCDYPDVRYTAFAAGPPGLADRPRAEHACAVHDAVMRIWARLTRAIDSPWTLTLEDDVIPPPDVIERLLRSVTPQVDAVVAPYVNRFGQHWIIYRGKNGVLRDQRGSGVERIDGAGFGCMLVRSQHLVHHVFTHGPTWRSWYDPWFTTANQLHMLCDWSIPVRHLPAETPDAATGTSRADKVPE